MARYPTIDTPLTPLDSTPLPYQRLDPPLTAFGGREAQALGQLSDTLQKGVSAFRAQPAEQPQEAPTGKVREPALHDIVASNAVDRFRLDAQHAHADYSSRRHGDAIDGYPQYRQALQDSRDQLLSGLQGPARSAAQPHLDRLHNESLSLGLQHRHQQDQAWSDRASQASLDVDVQEALLWRNNPIKLQRVVDRAGGEWMKLAERKGWDEQQTGQQIAQWNGRLYDTVIGQHLHDGNVDAAQTILTQAQGRLDPDTFDKLQGQVRVSLAQRGQQNHAVTQRIQLAQTNTGTMTDVQQFNGDSASGVSPGSQQVGKPDFGPNQPQSTGNAPEGRVASIDSSIEDSSDPNSGLSPSKSQQARNQQNNLIPTEITKKSQDSVLGNRLGDSPIAVPKWITPTDRVFDFQKKGEDAVDRPTARPKKYIPHPYKLSPENIGDQEIDLNEMYADLEFDPNGTSQLEAIISLPTTAANINRLRKEAERQTIKFINDNKLPPIWADSPTDAFRHAYWSYRLTQSHGPLIAKLFTDGHEVSGDADGNSQGANSMDLYNNRIGRILARDPANAKRNPAEVIWEALQKGLLRTSPFNIKPH
ncbi:MAG: hypothetical protein ABI439_11870 [Rhodospirillales bacterium]